MSTNNILSPANGKPVIIVLLRISYLGLYYMTRERQDQKVKAKFSSAKEVRIAFDADKLKFMRVSKFVFAVK
jgi:DNA-directed RNA polymerase beta' subunit